MARVAIFSTGIPDPSQGGSGIFNYYVSRELLTQNHQVTGFFRAGDFFLQNHTVSKYLTELQSLGLQSQLIKEVGPSKRGMMGWPLLLQSHNWQVCKNTVEQVIQQNGEYDAYIAHDLGWILALAELTDKPVVGLLGDPLHGRLRYGHDVDILSPRSWLLRWQANSVGGRKVMRQLAERLNNKIILGSFSPQHSEEYRAYGVDCEDFRWFSPEVESADRGSLQNANKKGLTLLHVGTLASTASSKMLRYWMEKLLPDLATLPFPIEIRFVGRSAKQHESQWPNIKLTYLGHEQEIDQEFNNCDLFFSPMKYPVGTRTRILTAMSYGMPTVADISAASGLPELKDGADIFYGHDAKSIKATLANLYADPQLRIRAGKQARMRWENLYQPRKNVGAILAAAGL